MKTIHHKLGLIVACAAIVVAGSIFAQGGPPPWAGQGRGAAAAEAVGPELVAIERFLSLSDAELQTLHDAIDRVQAMTPAERAAMLAQIKAFRRLPQGQRDEIRAGWGWLDTADREDWPKMMHSLEEAERAAIQAEIRALSPEQRAARKHELLEQWRTRLHTPPEN